MRTRLFSTVLLAASMVMPLTFAAGCAHEISRTETDRSDSSGRRTHEETIVTQNPDGSTSTSHEKKSMNP